MSTPPVTFKLPPWLITFLTLALRCFLAAKANGGGVLAVVVTVAGLTFVATIEFNPAEPVVDAVGDVTGIASSPTAPPPVCPKGWGDSSSRSGDMVIKSCTRGDWLVVLKPEGNFDYGTLIAVGGRFEEDSTKVDGWPR